MLIDHLFLGGEKDYWEVNVIISIQVKRKLRLKEGNDFPCAA